MKELVEYLKSNPVQYLATLGLDGKVKCRPFMFAAEYDKKLWFCTNSQKAVSKELKANSSFELTVSAPDFSWMRLSGEAIFENNMEVKELCMEIPIVKNIYKTADNPLFEVFYISNCQAIIADFSGNPPKLFNSEK
ncbi:MAG: pyridoxamine 5'-phosphate oxidase family protein [Rikenellaceae bacterium]